MKHLRNILFLLILLTFSVKLNAQDPVIDSLKTALKNAKHDTTIIKLKSEIGETEMIFRESYWDSLVKETKIMIEKNSPSKSFYLKYHAKALNNLGFLFSLKGEISKALAYFNESLKIRQSLFDKKGIATAFNNIGTIYDDEGNIDKAMEFYYKSLKIREEINDKYGIAVTLNNIGSLYEHQGEIQRAVELYNQSLKIRTELNDERGIAESLNNIGLIYKKDDINKALDFYNRSLKIREKINDRMGIANSLNHIGNIYYDWGEIQNAKKCYNRSLKIQEEIKDYTGMTYTLINIAKTFEEEGKIKESLVFAMRSFAISKELGYPADIKTASAMLKKIYRKQNKYKEALEMYELEIKMSDSIANESTKKASVKKQFQYEYEKKATADSVKNSEEQKVKNAQLTAQKAQLKQEKTQRFALYGGLALMLVFAGFMFNRFKVTQRQKNVITLQKVKVDEAYEELNQQNEEIATQRDEIEMQKTKVEQHQKEIIDSITYAKRLQEAILPSKEFVTKHIPENFILYKPKDLVAGDFYWMEVLPGGEDLGGATILIAAADSTGHGVPGAMVSVVCSNALNRSLKEFGLTDPGLLLDKTRELVLETFSKSSSDVKDGMDISLMSIEFPSPVERARPEPVEGDGRERSEIIIKWSGANNPLWYLLPGATELSEIKANKQPIGKTDNPSPFTTHTILLPYGEERGGATFYLFTDGYADQFGGDKGKKFKYKQLEELLIANVNLGLNQQSEILNSKFENWKGDLEQVDDVCVIGVKL